MIKFTQQIIFFGIYVLMSTQVLAQQKKAVEVSLMLPFCSKQIIENPNHANAELGNLCREYYQGVLVALDSFEQAKVKVNLSVFDTENDSLKTVSITQNALFKSSELVIGPVRPGGNQVVSTFSKNNQVFHVSPLMTLSKTKINDPFWISANPDLPSYASILLAELLKHETIPNIIVIADKSTFGKSLATGFKAIDKKMAKVKVIDYLPGLTITEHTSNTAPNHIVVATTNEAIVNNCLRSIKDTTSVFALKTYGFMTWFDFKNVDYTLMMRCNTHFITPFFVNYEQPEVKAFVEKYRNKFNTEPTEAAFKGYDQFLLFTKQVALNGKPILNNLTNNTATGLGSRFKIEKQKEGWYQNMSLFVLPLKNYKLQITN